MHYDAPRPVSTITILDQIIDQILIAEQARQTPGAQVSEEMVDTQVDAFRSRFAWPIFSRSTPSF